MFQPRGEDGEEREVTEWRLRKYLRMQSKQKRPEFRQPAAMPMSGPSMFFYYLILIFFAFLNLLFESWLDFNEYFR